MVNVQQRPDDREHQARSLRAAIDDADDEQHDRAGGEQRDRADQNEHRSSREAAGVSAPMVRAGEMSFVVRRIALLQFVEVQASPRCPGDSATSSVAGDRSPELLQAPSHTLKP